MKNPKSIAHSVYTNSEFVNQYATNIIDNAWNAYYERPATLSLLPNVVNKTVLDAGCGPGIVSEILIKRGATVTSIDYSSVMVKKTKERLGHDNRIFVHDLNDELEMFSDNEFDIIYSSLTIHYIDNLDKLFSEFSRVLKSNGTFIFSTDHPENPDFTADPITEKRLNEVPWGGYKIKMPVIERPWKDILSALENNGFEVDTTLTPQPTEECRVKYPHEYEVLSSSKHFICVRVKKK